MPFARLDKRAPVLMIPLANDIVFFPDENMRALKTKLSEGGKVEYTEVITSPMGHLDGIANIAKAGDVIAKFLAE